jgi:hypothetical protein
MDVPLLLIHVAAVCQDTLGMQETATISVYLHPLYLLLSIPTVVHVAIQTLIAMFGRRVSRSNAWIKRKNAAETALIVALAIMFQSAQADRYLQINAVRC